MQYQASTEGSAGYQTSNTQVNVLNQFFEYFNVRLPAPSYAPYESPFLDTEDLQERFSLLQERLARLNTRLEEHQEKATRLERSVAANLHRVQGDLAWNLRTFLVAESNPAAAERRTFLQGESIKLETELHQLSLRELDRVIELERHRDELLLEYVHLRRVVKSLE